MARPSSQLASTLQSYAKPSRPVDNSAIPAYGLTLAGGSSYGAVPNGRGGSLTSYALPFTTGIIVGAFLTVRFNRR